MVRKYAKKQFRRAKKYLKKRYVPNGKLDVQRIAKDVWKLKDIINSELKHKDTIVAQTVIPNPSTNVWSLTLLNGLTAQDGADPGEREGMNVRFKSLQLNGRIKLATTTATQATRVRMMLIVDKQCLVSGLATPPIVQDLLTQPGGTGNNFINAMRSWESLQQKRFTVLMNRVFTLDDDYPEKHFKIYKKIDMVTSWAPGYTASNAISRNALYLVFMSDNVGADDAASFDFASRITYRDN